MANPIGFIFYLAVLIFSVVVHEISHGVMARRLGDPTAEMAGRLTLNPIKHLDPFGSIFFPLISVLFHSPVLLAWAKPVPYNPANLSKDYKYGPLKVALAGPLSNLVLFLIFGILARALIGVASPLLIGGFAFVALINCSLMIFNLVPIPPLDGSKILPLLLPPRYAHALERIGMMGIIFVLVFVFFFSWLISSIVMNLTLMVAGPAALSQGFEVIAQIFGRN